MNDRRLLATPLPAPQLARLVALIQAAAIRPKTRRATRPTKGSKERRLEAKALRSRSVTKRAAPSAAR